MRYLYHHCMNLEDVSFSEIVPSPVHSFRKLRTEYRDESDPPSISVHEPIVESEMAPNWWLESKIGFYPLFLAVGGTLGDVEMTGYAYQWKRIVRTIPDKSRPRKMRNVLAKAGDIPNRVLFSYSDPPSEDIKYVDYGAWFIALNSSHCDYKIGKRETSMILKPSWTPSDWLRMARKHPHHVMAVIPKLDLRRADRIWVRNMNMAKLLTDMGFKGVKVKRLRSPQ